MSAEHLLGLLRLPPVQRAIFAIAASGAIFPIVGVWIIGLNIVPVRFAMMHVALLGISVGILLGWEPNITGIVMCGITGALLSPLARRPSGLAGPMGLVMTFAIALALLILSISGVNANGAFELLWGAILATRVQDVVNLISVAALIIAVYFKWRKELALLLYDREIALISGVPVDGLTLLLMVVVAIAIGSSVRLTGALLVDSITILPAFAARNLGRSLKEMILWAMGVGLVGNLAGFALTLILNQPPGPVLVITVSLITLATYFVKQS
ncbi:MAG TPA: metal ABC transporter permease [Anaerolineales bacterium]|nr:metal ABC transporter permease [Anaerolineales bacterium]